MSFLNQLVIVQVSLNGFWINFRVLDCPTPLPESSADGLPVQVQNPSGDCMTTTPASNTGSEEMPSSSTTRPVITSGPKLPLIIPNRWDLKKPVLYLQACLWYGLGCNDRLLDCCADVDIATIYDGEADPFDQPVLDHKDRKVTPPDLRKERQMALCEELLKPKYAVNGFKTAELQRSLSDLFGNPAQTRYEMKKLVARGAIKKQKNKSFYRVTETGWKWLWTSITSKRYFRNPVISATFKTGNQNSPTQPYILEQGLNLINQGLSQITQELAVNM